MWSIYKHIFPNGKVYIGLTKQLPSNRFKNGYGYEKCPLMWKAIKKYGWENVVTEWLKVDISTLEEAGQLEQQYIKEYNSRNPNYGYNLANGGQGGATYKYNHQEIINYWEEGLNTKDISKIMGCSFSTIRRVLDEYNIPSEERRQRQNDVNGQHVKLYDYNKIVELWKQGATCKEIELEVGCCRGTINLALTKMGISLEEREKQRIEHSKKAIKQKYG